MSPLRRHGALVLLLACAIMLPLLQTVAPGGNAAPIVSDVIATAAAALTYAGARRRDAAARVAWKLLAGALACFAIGDVSA